MHRQLAAAILFAVATMPSGTAYAQDSENEFPAKLTVVSQHVDDVGRRHVRVRLIVDDDVAVYAHQLGFAGMEHASAKLTVFDADRKPLRVKVTYPQGEKLETEFFGVWYLYRDAVDMKVVVPANSSLPLILRCRVAGYNEQGSYCLGFGWLETKIAANQRRTEQGDEPKSR